jgi:hypothetical protein
MHRGSEADLFEDQRKRGPSSNEKLIMFRTMARIMVDEEHVPDPQVRPRTYSEIPRTELVRALTEVEELIRPRDYSGAIPTPALGFRDSSG